MISIRAGKSVISENREEGERSPRYLPKGRPKDRAHTVTGLDQVAKILLIAIRITVIARRDRKTGPTRGNQRHEAGLIGICAGSIHVSPIAKHYERKGLVCPHGHLGPEGRGRIRPQQVNLSDRAGAEIHAIAILSPRLKGELCLPLVLKNPIHRDGRLGRDHAMCRAGFGTHFAKTHQPAGLRAICGPVDGGIRADHIGEIRITTQNGAVTVEGRTRGCRDSKESNEREVKDGKFHTKMKKNLHFTCFQRISFLPCISISCRDGSINHSPARKIFSFVLSRSFGVIDRTTSMRIWLHFSNPTNGNFTIKKPRINLLLSFK